MREVTFCERSTITEAWATVFGRAVPFVPEERAAAVLVAKRSLPELSHDPALVVAEVPREGPVSPFWSQQWSWDGGRLRARVGHRYLSVHRLADETDRYETYGRSLAPALDPWLTACSSAFDDALILAAFEQVSYGYVNTFRYAAAGFDLSKAFHLNIGVELDGLDSGLGGLEVGFHYMDHSIRPATRVMIQVALRPDGPIPDADELLVETKTTATFTVANGFWRDHDLVKRELIAAKQVAKRAFFQFATPETHREMGARYDDPT